MCVRRTLYVYEKEKNFGMRFYLIVVRKFDSNVSPFEGIRSILAYDYNLIFIQNFQQYCITSFDSIRLHDHWSEFYRFVCFHHTITKCIRVVQYSMIFNKCNNWNGKSALFLFACWLCQVGLQVLPIELLLINHIMVSLQFI